MLTQDLNALKNKAGEDVVFVVTQDVVINDVVVVSKGTKATGKIVDSKVAVKHKGNAGKVTDLRVELLEVPAVDGTPLPLSDCWIENNAAQNLNGKGAIMVKGTRKNCDTTSKVKIKAHAK